MSDSDEVEACAARSSAVCDALAAQRQWPAARVCLIKRAPVADPLPARAASSQLANTPLLVRILVGV